MGFSLVGRIARTFRLDGKLTVLGYVCPDFGGYVYQVRRRFVIDCISTCTALPLMKLQDNRPPAAKRSISEDMSDDERDIDIESDVSLEKALCWCSTWSIPDVTT